MEHSTLISKRAGDSGAASPGRLLIEHSAGDFQEKFDRDSFQFTHRLANHPAFQLPELIKLAKRLNHNIYFDHGDIQINDRWNEAPPKTYSVDEVLEKIENAGAWFFVKNAHEAPDYCELVDQCLAEAEELTGRPFQKGMRNREMIIFLTSPNRIATYHIDRECSFLLQISGSKTIHIFNRNDRDVLPEEEIEKFWTRDNNAPRYRAQYQDRAASYRLSPGVAVHIPVNFPHWVQNDNNVSVSVNLNVQFADSYRADTYRANYCLRMLGLNPTPPGRFPDRDALKAQGYNRLRQVCGFLGKRLP